MGDWVGGGGVPVSGGADGAGTGAGTGADGAAVVAAAAEDPRAPCLCHHRLTSIGHVCGACLGLSCARLPRCPACGARFGLQAAEAEAGVGGGAEGGAGRVAPGG